MPTYTTANLLELLSTYQQCFCMSIPLPYKAGMTCTRATFQARCGGLVAAFYCLDTLARDHLLVQASTSILFDTSRVYEAHIVGLCEARTQHQPNAEFLTRGLEPNSREGKNTTEDKIAEGEDTTYFVCPEDMRGRNEAPLLHVLPVVLST